MTELAKLKNDAAPEASAPAGAAPRDKVTGPSFTGNDFGPADLQLLIDTLPALIHTSRPDGYLDYFNQRWLEYLGVPLENMEGWNWTRSIHPDDVEGIVNKWRACLASGEVFEHECRVRRADGEYRWMVHRKVPLHNGRGKIVKWYTDQASILRIESARSKLWRRHLDKSRFSRISCTKTTSR